MAKKLHEYNHNTIQDMRRLCKLAGRYNEDVEHALKRVTEECIVCIQTGHPIPSRKISTKHIDCRFNKSVQIGLFFTQLGMTERTHCFVNVRCAGTGHGAPVNIGGDPEWDKESFRRLAVHSPLMDIDVLAAGTCFLSNLFAGSRVASSFELARGYVPSISGLKSGHTREDIIQSHRERVAKRALTKLMSSHQHETIRKALLAPGDLFWIFDKDKKWHKMIVRSAEPYFVTCRRNKKRLFMKVAYEDVRFALKHQLDKEIMYLELGGKASLKLETNDNIQARASDIENKLPEMHSIVMSEQMNISSGELLKDTGAVISNRIPDLGLLKSVYQQALRAIRDILGYEQVTLRKLDFAPPWVSERAYREEEMKWEGTFEAVDQRDISPTANIIRSPVVYKVKDVEDGTLKMKARICLNGNQDCEKGNLRKDSAAVQYQIIRLALSLATLLGFRICLIDIESAYFQSEPIKRLIYVIPPKEHNCKQKTLWKLLKLPHGIAEAGRQWQQTCERWLLSVRIGFLRVLGFSQLFILKRNDSSIRMLCEKLTDDFLISGSESDIQWFTTEIRRAFRVGKVITEGKMNFNGCIIEQDAIGNIRMSMKDYMNRMREIPISPEGRKQQAQKENKQKRTSIES
eukprot:IDg22738t1